MGGLIFFDFRNYHRSGGKNVSWENYHHNGGNIYIEFVIK